MNKEKALTYSLLAHIRNTGTLAKGPIDIFIPLVKRALSKLNSDGLHKGDSILAIKNATESLYKIDFPIPVLKKILDEICKEVNASGIQNFIVYNDGAFSINKYVFSDYEEIIKNQEAEINELEELFKNFCNISELKEKSSDSIFKFIERNKYTLSKYISNNSLVNGDDYTSEAQFIKYFSQIPSIYDRIKSIYLGSIISGYIEYNPDGIKREIEILLDTNFIVGLLDLNTPESTHTCRTLISIAKQQGFKITVLKDTIEETKNLLETKALYFEKSFLQKKVNPEDVYNACDRRGLSKIDLERISDNIEMEVVKFDFVILPYTEKLKNEARYTEEYRTLVEVRNSKKSALHDAIAILYIQKQRGKRIKEFEKVNAWFVNNSISVQGETIFLRDGYQPETIKADDLLNILWLSNPQISKEISGDDLAEIGLTSTISLTLNKNLPKSQILRELDDNIHKYAKEEISDLDVIRVATRITNKQLKDIEELNLLAESDKEQFVKRLEEEASKQKRIEDIRIQKLEDVFKEISTRTEDLEKARKNFERKSETFDGVVKAKNDSDLKVEQLQQQLLQEQNNLREMKRNQWIQKEVSKWRIRSWVEVSILIILALFGFLFMLWWSSWSFVVALKKYEELNEHMLISSVFTLIFSGISVLSFQTLVNKYRDHSNIQNYIKGLTIPNELKETK